MSRDPYNAVITWIEEPDPAKPGPLEGRRLLVKDLIDTAGVRTTYGSRIYAEHVPERTAPVVERLVDAGAVVVGKANLPEFAWSVLGQNPWYGTVHNPVRPGITTGGSSSGSGAALAAGLCDLSLGTDTGGSIRLPAACCDIVGLKPHWGGIPLEGIFPLSPSLDTVGPMARTVEEVALAWSVLTGKPVPEPRLEGETMSVIQEPPSVGDGRKTERSDAVFEWAPQFERLGARILPTRLPEPSANMWPLFYEEARRSHAATFPSRADEYDPVLRVKLEAAQTTNPDEVAAAYAGLEEWRLYEPAVGFFIAPCIAIDLPPEDVPEPEVRFPFSSCARWVNLIGWASLAIGNMQLIAPADETVLAAGLAWEQAVGSPDRLRGGLPTEK